MVAVVAQRARSPLSEAGSGGDIDLQARIRTTVDLMDRRGYGVTLEHFARLLYGGSVAPSAVSHEIPAMPDLSLEDGLVIRRDRRAEHFAMRARQANHATHARGAESLAVDFAARLVSTCPFVESVSLTGSMASGGFQPQDDVDVNITTRSGSKYTVYLWSLALAAVTSLRNRGKPTDEMGTLPFLPKIICINVVWEDRQLRPLARQDQWIAYELMMHRPILGAVHWRAILDQNRWMEAHFPQVYEPGFVGSDSKEAERLAAVRRRGRALFSFLGRHPIALKAVEATSRLMVMGMHRVVSLMRGRQPQARQRETFVNLVKRPYSVYDVPGRERPVPSAAFEPR
jgi:hypothetical protein